MIDAVFISDLHLSPDEPAITYRFDAFLQWAENTVKTIYILGDYFHAWPGDDGMDDWCKEIAKKTRKLRNQGILIYYMHGNRDFLLGQAFADLAGWQIITEPTLLEFGNDRILLSHGDRYCTRDKSHQWFRRFTRNGYFIRFFRWVPYSIRSRLVKGVRQHSQSNRKKQSETMDVVKDAYIKHMQTLKADILIHGHTHKPGLDCVWENNINYQRYILSDWDDSPKILCYDRTEGFYFTQSYKKV